MGLWHFFLYLEVLTSVQLWYGTNDSYVCYVGHLPLSTFLWLLLNHFDYFQQYIFEWKSRYWSKFVDLYPVYNCNVRCLFCRNRKLPTDMMWLSNFLQITNHLALQIYAFRKSIVNFYGHCKYCQTKTGMFFYGRKCDC